MSKEKENKSESSGSSQYRDPLISYEHAKFGLKHFVPRVQAFWDEVNPEVWTVYDSIDVNVMEDELLELLQSLKGWDEKIVLACSVLKDSDTILQNHQIDINNCRLILKRCQRVILKAQAQCVLEEEKAKPKKVTTSQTFKLDKIKLPTFSGNFVEWQDFADLFRVAVNDDPNIPSAVKLKYLKDSLTGDAHSIVATFPSLPNSYDKAWKLVEDRYDNPREIVFSHLRKFHTFKPVTDSSKGLRQLGDTINECTRALKMLEIPVDEWDVIIVFLALTKLEEKTKTEWLLTQEKELPDLLSFLGFLEKRASALVDPRSQSTPSKKSTSSNHTSTGEGTLSFRCLKCGESHRLYQCENFKSLSLKSREKFVKQKNLCKNCLNGGHTVAECKAKFNCRQCHQRHSALLHKDESSPSSSSGGNSNATRPVTVGPQTADSTAAQQTESTSSSEPTVSSSHTTTPPSDTVILMATFLVHIRDSTGEKVQVRVFYDPGSEANFISENAVARLGLRRQRSCVQITGIGGHHQDTSQGIVHLEIFSRISNFFLPVQAHILRTLTGQLPRASCKADYAHIRGLELADPHFQSPSHVDIVLGAGTAAQIILPGIRRGPPGTPVATNSRFGWYLTGTAPSLNATSNFTVMAFHATCSVDNRCLESALQRFWELEEPEPASSHISEEDQLCETHFAKTVSREADGRFCVQLPFSSSTLELGESRGKAIQCLKSLEKQLDKNEEMKLSYQTQMTNFLHWKWLEPVSPESVPQPLAYYMPHHIVSKLDSTTTKFRIVFNASAKTTTGQSLNSTLMSGPKIQTDLHPLLVRFRSHPIAVSVDIVKFYQQVKVAEQHRDFQRLVWRKSPEDKPQDFRFTRVTFGVTSAPFLAIRCLKELGQEHEDQFPLASHAINYDFLVDNLLSGAESIEEAIQLKTEITQVLAKGQFPLQKWASNNHHVLGSCTEDERDSYSMDIRDDESIKTIGLFWHPASDKFGVKISIPPVSSSVTKREVLSFTARIFDPLSWLAPVTITPRILLQALWKLKLDWDNPIPHHLFQQWMKYCQELEFLKQFRINRCLTLQSPPSSSITHELIGFCDASNQAYAACVYLRSRCQDQTQVELIAAKAKVAPVNGDTTPRLELCSAVLLTRLLNFTNTALLPSRLNISRVLAFTDSTGALGQLFSNEKQPVFVTNRVRKIRNSAIDISWFHVPGRLNPADPASRGISSKEFMAHPLWLHGPPFLITGELPPQPYEESLITSPSHHAAVRSYESTFVIDSVIAMVQRHSLFSKMKRLLAYWIRYIHALKAKAPITGPLTLAELNQALIPLVKSVQRVSFQKEIDCCLAESQISAPIKFLSPFLDAEGILRVGGRLQQSELHWDQQHPILLPKGHQRSSSEEYKAGHLSRVIARYYHVTNLHAGPQHLLSLIRQKFWIPRGPNLCTKIVRMCIKCHRQNPVPTTQIMGQLPSSRVVPDFPFVTVGIDYAGPFEIAVTPGRKPRLIKAYVCVFKCFVTKAVHLEFASDLSTPAFIAAFQRFIAIRNTPSDIHCDGGRNFLGAKEETEKMQKFLTDPSHQSKVADYFAGENVRYHFSPPCGPHHGGFWESCVKSMKYHLKRVIDGRHVSLEELMTLLARTSGALNSRPLTPLSNSPDDFGVLTPFHFLTFRSPKVPTELDLTATKGTKTRWQLVQQMSQHLFRRWATQYLQSLQQKHKWLEPKANIQPGTLVLLQDVDSSIGPQHWKLGRIQSVYPGPDGRVRIVDVKIYVPATPKKKETFRIYRRPITRLSPLPLDDQLVNAHVTIN